MIERRAKPRHKTLIKGRIYFNNRLSSMDCIVREVGDGGSRLEFSENVTLPDVFELYLPSKDEYFQAHIVWRKGQNPRAESGRTDHHLADRVTKLEREVAVLLKRMAASER